jgi:hypothetical protein
MESSASRIVGRPMRPVRAAPEAGGDHRAELVVLVGGQPVGAGPILPVETVSVLVHKDGPGFAVRQPSVGLFLALEVRLLDGPLFVGEHYDVVHTIVGSSESRRTESFRTETALTPAVGGRTIATVLLHQGVFKDSFTDYPRGAAANAPA